MDVLTNFGFLFPETVSRLRLLPCFSETAFLLTANAQPRNIKNHDRYIDFVKL